MKLSIDFAFAGIDIIKKNPLAVLLWGLLSVAVSTGTTLLTVIVAGPAMAALQSYNTSPPDDPMAVFAQMGALAPVWIISIVVGLISASIIQCAVFRSQLQPQAGGLGFMRLGGAEIRQIFVAILWWLAFVGFYLLFGLALFLVLMIGGLVMQSSEILGGVIIFVSICAAIVAFLYIVSRWSLVMVQSFAEEKINIFGSFKLTKGSGWTLFGGYVLLLIVALVIMIIVYSLLFALLVGTSGGWVQAFQQMSNPDMSSVTGVMTPMFLSQIGVGGLMTGAFYALFYGASVAAYRVLSDKGTQADVF